eukprot:9737214-Karenia_brevis.AAC.1
MEKEKKEEQNRTQQKGRSRLLYKSIALMRKSKLWVKTDWCLILKGIVQTLGSGARIILRDDQAAQALVQEWQSSFVYATGDQNANKSFL